MKVSTLVLASILLLAAPEPKISVRPTPAPTPEYTASEPAAEYEENLRPQEKEQNR